MANRARLHEILEDVGISEFTIRDDFDFPEDEVVVEFRARGIASLLGLLAELNSRIDVMGFVAEGEVTFKLDGDE